MTVEDLHAKDWEEAQAAAQRTYFPHDLHTLERTEANFRLVSVDLGPVVIGRIGWGGDVAIDCEYPDAIEINAPLSGALESRMAGAWIRSIRGAATVFRANERHAITRWGADCEVIGVKLDARWLAEQARLGFGHVGPLQLPHQLDLTGARFDSWNRLTGSLLRAGVTEPTVAAPLASALATSLLLAVLPTHSEPAHTTRVPASVVDRVRDAFGDNPHHAWTAVEMAQHAGVSVRRMQEIFATELGRTPRQVLQEMRLDQARAELRAGGNTVTDVATSLGFTNPGRFSAAYRQRFGVLPSQDAAGD